MTKPLIVMALESEGQGRLEALGFEVIYCGVGKVNAAYALTKALYEHKAAGMPVGLVLSVGSAGSGEFNRGMLVECTGYVQRDMDATGIGFAFGQTPFEDGIQIDTPKLFDDLPSGICGTGDSFLQTPPPIPCNVIEMEAFALAKICRAEGVAFSSVKYITDGADEGASTDWVRNLKEAAEAFVTFLKKHYG